MSTLWTLQCTVLVVSMQLGFALLECGLTEASNAVSILSKNVMDFCLGGLVYIFVGYTIAFGGLHPFNAAFASQSGGVYEFVHPYAHLLFHMSFAATSATICSGAFGGRIHLGPYLLFSAAMTGLVYPVVSGVIWGRLAFQPSGSGLPPYVLDYAGSLVVHATGGAASLAGVLVLGVRKDRAARPHNVPLATAGTFVLVLGWYGFNMGSTLQNMSTKVGVAEVAMLP